MNHRYYIANCISRILMAGYAPNRHKELCDDLAMLVQIADSVNIAGAHEEAKRLLAQAESGYYLKPNKTARVGHLSV